MADRSSARGHCPLLSKSVRRESGTCCCQPPQPEDRLEFTRSSQTTRCHYSHSATTDCAAQKNRRAGLGSSEACARKNPRPTRRFSVEAGRPALGRRKPVAQDRCGQSFTVKPESPSARPGTDAAGKRAFLFLFFFFFFFFSETSSGPGRRLSLEARCISDGKRPILELPRSRQSSNPGREPNLSRPGPLNPGPLLR